MTDKYVIDLEKRVEHLETRAENLANYNIVKEIIFSVSDLITTIPLFRFDVITFNEETLVFQINKVEIYNDKNYSPAEVVYSYFKKIDNLMMFHTTYLELELMLKQVRGK
jgi:hypothetical protein